MDHEIDQASLDLIIQLQLQDAQSMIKGKYREGEAPDFEMALEVFNAELESLHVFLHDREMGRSLARAVVSDANIIRELANEEEQATRDRMIALHGFGQDDVARDDFFRDEGPPRTDSLKGTISDEMVNKLIVLFHDSDGPSSAAESSRRGGQIKALDKASKRRRCIVCSEDFPFVDTLQCACSHDYCRGCLSNYINKALSDESIFPPRCCGKPIPLDGVNQIFIPADILGKYRAKELEYSSTKRTYCHVPSCSTFIPTQFIQDEVATCVKCQRKTCTICRDASHEGDCPKDTATTTLLRVAGDHGWKRCFKCRRVVELAQGCNHIYCRCGAQFCYICEKRWKTCGCQLWDENMLIAQNAAVNGIANRAPIRAAPLAAPQAAPQGLPRVVPQVLARAVHFQAAPLQAAPLQAAPLQAARLQAARHQAARLQGTPLQAARLQADPLGAAHRAVNRAAGAQLQRANRGGGL